MLDDDKKLDLDSLDQLLEDAELMQLTGGVPDAPSAQAKPMVAPPPVTEAPKPTLPPAPVKQNEASRSESTQSSADRLSATQDKHNRTNNSTQDAWTEQEMDGIKKLIIIFGSSILVISLSAVGIAVGGLMKTAKPSPELISSLEETKIGVEETYKLAESNNREIKELGLKVTEIITQLSETEAVMGDIKAISEEQLQHAASVTSGSQPASSPKKSVAAVADAAVESVSKPTAHVAPSVGLTSNDPQVIDLSADMKDIKRRLSNTYKALENLQKQSNGLQRQSQELMDVIRAVETEVKSRKAVKSTANTVRTTPAKTNKPAEESQSSPYRDEQAYRYTPVKPVDDSAARMRWQQQMDKTDSFP